MYRDTLADGCTYWLPNNVGFANRFISDRVSNTIAHLVGANGRPDKYADHVEPNGFAFDLSNNVRANGVADCGAYHVALTVPDIVPDHLGTDDVALEFANHGEPYHVTLNLALRLAVMVTNRRYCSFGSLPGRTGADRGQSRGAGLLRW